jgi:hypothetical protein
MPVDLLNGQREFEWNNAGKIMIVGKYCGHIGNAWVT